MIRVGKKSFSWNSVKARLAGFPTEKITSVDWDEKIEAELVYAARRDGTPLDMTAGKYAPGVLTIKMLLEEWAGAQAKGVLGFSNVLSLGKTVGISDVECDFSLQFFEEIVGVSSFAFPVIRPIGPIKISTAVATSAQEVEVGFQVIAPIKLNGTQLASLIRSFGGI